MKTAFLLLILPLLLVAHIACKSGGRTTPPLAVPVITSVQPDGIVGSAGGWVRFSAAATNDPTEWEWDFGGGGNQ